MTTLLPSIEFSKAESWIINCLFQKDGAPINLAGATIEWVVASAYDEQPIYTATVGSGITVISAPAGTAKINSTPLSHDDVPDGTYVHQARVTEASGDASVQFQGEFVVAPSPLTA